MRELKGDWRDLFNGFMLALDLRKMFLAFAGLLFTAVFCGGVTILVSYMKYREGIHVPQSMAPHELWATMGSCWHVIYKGAPLNPTPWFVFVPYSIVFLAMLFAIWGYFGGAIARIAAYEIAKDGERIETTRAMRFAGRKFWSFFFAPVICVVGFLFFWFCNFAAGFVGKFFDYLFIGGPLLTLFLPLAVLAGFIMLLIVVGSFAGFPLFTPAVAAEGTDSFDAVSRGFSYVYSRPWHFLGYQGVSAVYGILCIAFVFLFAVGMADLGVKAGSAGFDLVNLKDEDKTENFDQIRQATWGRLLSKDHENAAYGWKPEDVVRHPHPYGRIMYLAGQIAGPSFIHGRDKAFPEVRWHGVASWILLGWLIIVLGHAYGYAVSYVISQQTMIYYILRKKVDGIEMNEVFEEAEDEESLPEPGAPPQPEPKKEGEPAAAEKETVEDEDDEKEGGKEGGRKRKKKD